MQIRLFALINRPLYFIFFFPLFFFLTSTAQSDFILEQEFETTADLLSVDNLGDIYLVDGDQVQKLSPGINLEWKQVSTYSNKLLGKITFLDAGNPLKLLLFYSNHSLVVFLDNTLSAQGEPLELQKLGLEQATLVCSSLNNGLWLYDQRNFELIRLDHNLQRIVETGNIVQQTGGKLQPDYLIEKNNNLYLNDPGRGILVFDIYGTYVKTIPIKNLESFQISNEFILYKDEKKVYAFSLKTNEQQEISIPETPFKTVWMDGDRVYLLTGDRLKIYRRKI